MARKETNGMEASTAPKMVLRLEIMTSTIRAANKDFNHIYIRLWYPPKGCLHRKNSVLP